MAVAILFNCSYYFKRSSPRAGVAANASSVSTPSDVDVGAASLINAASDESDSEHDDSSEMLRADPSSSGNTNQ